MPWKNGGGSTTEIAVRPEGAGLDDFLWRVSMAHVASDGPFSAFPGIDRTLTLLTGAGMRLTAGETSVDLTPGSAPFAFSGDAPASATLTDGPVTDLNVMTRRATLRHRVLRLVWPADVRAAMASLVYAPHGQCRVETADAGFDLEAGDTAIVENEAFRVAPATGTTVYLVEIEPAA